MFKLVFLLFATLVIFPACQDTNRTIQTPIGYPTPTPHEKFLNQSIVGTSIKLKLPEVINFPDASYDWEQITGPVVVINNANTKEPEVIPIKAGLYAFKAIVRQGTVISSVVTLSVQVTDSPPKISINNPVSGYFGTDIPVDVSIETTTNTNQEIGISFSLDGGYSFQEATVNDNKEQSIDQVYLWNASEDLTDTGVADVVLRVQYSEDFDVTVLTFDPLFGEALKICSIEETVWPFLESAAAPIHLNFDLCQKTISTRVTTDFRSHVAPAFDDLDQTVLLNLPIWLAEHSSATIKRIPNTVELDFFLEKASENIAQIESLVRLASSKPTSNLDTKVTDSIISALDELRVTTNVRHQFTLARIRHILY